ncbi:phosphoadenylyl-sulfate reductase [Pararhizobium haloflavum]|uniref:phosphoadenylyl-sulfate reductase n=1 Tax=Pararhizobium haloflavum TaxID=2037914 RepID=UPI000C1901C3|nr:phosphoadenylyl-sulfate reductase [Pararhizobium haloflavum]
MTPDEAQTLIDEIASQFAARTLEERLAWLHDSGRRIVFTTSLGIEDQVVTDGLASALPSASIVTLDTGRLFDETLALITETERHYGIAIERFKPEAEKIDRFVATYGLNGFYESVAARHACCGVRKVEPLGRALAGADVWITGLRRGQSAARGAVAFAEWDSDHEVLKVNPLADWSLAEIRQRVQDRAIPINPLHARGYPSIGCAPCTRAVKPGEDERAGRWWWENDTQRECGLHVAGAASELPARQNA